MPFLALVLVNGVDAVTVRGRNVQAGVEEVAIWQDGCGGHGERYLREAT